MLVWRFGFQTTNDEIVTSMDTDFAGCLPTRRSTSGGAAMRGRHVLKHWSTTQGTVTLSSAEAELNGITKGASLSLGLQSVAAELGFHWPRSLLTDSSAAIGITRRRGLGKIRHLAAADLWVQDRVRAGDFKIHKIEGVKNVSDILTKFVDRPTLLRHLEGLGLVTEDGRAELAPTIDT